MMDDSHEQNNGSLNRDLSVLDWVKSIIRGQPIPIPPETSSASEPVHTPARQVPEDLPQEQRARSILLSPAQIRFPAAIFLGLVAQFILENYREDPTLAIAFYVIAGLLIFWAVWRSDYRIEPVAALSPPFAMIRFRPTYLVIAIASVC